MAWAMVFWMYAQNGSIHKNTLHGYGTRQDCIMDAKQMSPRFDFISYQCVEDLK